MFIATGHSAAQFVALLAGQGMFCAGPIYIQFVIKAPDFADGHQRHLDIGIVKTYIILVAHEESVQ